MIKYRICDYFLNDNFPYKIKNSNNYRIRLKKPMVMCQTHWITPPGLISDCLIIEKYQTDIDVCFETQRQIFSLFRIKNINE